MAESISFLDASKAVAKPGFNRWLVPPAALAIHLSIGQVYAFSVFKAPLTHLLGGTGDWSQPQIARIFSIAIAFLGVSAAVFGKWLERNGPRKAMFIAAICFAAGFFISAIGVHLHQLWLIYLGYGALGGIGLGLGYISPVATLIRWFPDRPGMASGLAIMGFGGGAMVGGPLASALMNHFKTPDHLGVAHAFAIMGALYFCFMMFGVFTIRTPAPGWKPAHWTPSPNKSAMVTTQNISVAAAMRSPQFWLLWLVLCLNTTAGIGIIEQAALMIRDFFHGAGTSPARITEAAAVGFVGLVSLFNMAGRFFWSSVSDYLGRKGTFLIFFALGAAVFIGITFTGADHLNSVPAFVALCLVVISMYGGGFATMPAYVKDLFGSESVSAIYGRVLTAWSAAGIIGPLLVNTIHAHEVARGLGAADAYRTVLYLMAALLLAGFVCNALIRPLKQDSPPIGNPVDRGTPPGMSGFTSQPQTH